MPVRSLPLYRQAEGDDNDPTLQDWALRRRIAEAMAQQSQGAEPVQHWTQGAAKLAQAAVTAYQRNQVRSEQEAARAEAARLLSALIPRSGPSIPPEVAAEAEMPAGPVNQAPVPQDLRPQIAAALPSPDAGFGGEPQLALPVPQSLPMQPQASQGAGRFAAPNLQVSSGEPVPEGLRPQIATALPPSEADFGAEPQMAEGGVTATTQPMREQMAAALAPQYLDQMRQFEGYTPRAKWDYKQHSVGYGTRARHPGETITRAEAERRFQDEVGKAKAVVDQIAPDAPEGVKAALTSLTYNAGAEWTRSGLGALVRAGDYDGAAQRIQQYNRAGGQVLPGLASRRRQEASWMGGGGGGRPRTNQVAQAGSGSPQLDYEAMLRNPYTAPLARQLILQQVGPVGAEGQLDLELKRAQLEKLRGQGSKHQFKTLKEGETAYAFDERTGELTPIGGGGPGAGSSAPTAVKTDAYKTDQAYHALLPMLDDYQKTVERTGYELRAGPDKDSLLRKRRNIQLQMKELYNLGVLNGPDLQLMDDMLFDPTGDWLPPAVRALAGSAGDRTQSSVSDIKEMLRQLRNSKAGALNRPPIERAPETRELDGKTYVKRDGKWYEQ